MTYTTRRAMVGAFVFAAAACAQLASPTVGLAEEPACPYGTYWNPAVVQCLPVGVNPVLGPAGPVGAGGVVGPVDPVLSVPAPSDPVLSVPARWGPAGSAPASN